MISKYIKILILFLIPQKMLDLIPKRIISLLNPKKITNLIPETIIPILSIFDLNFFSLQTSSISRTHEIRTHRTFYSKLF